MPFNMKIALMTFSLIVSVKSQQELFMNPGFESPMEGHWESNGFTISLSNDAHSGQHSLKSSNRMQNRYLGPGQLVNILPGKLYRFSAYVKQLNDMPGKLFQSYRANVGYTWVNDGHTWQQYVVHHTSVISQGNWFRLLGFFRAPTRKFVYAKLHIQSPDIGIEFLLDDCTLTEIPDNPNWKAEADQRIQKLRMGDIHFIFNVSSRVNANEFDVQIDLKKHEFGWGTLVQDRFMLDKWGHEHYRQVVYDLFNTATTQALKWLFDRGSQGHPDYSQAIDCMKLLKEHGMRVRAHNMFWGFTKNLPQYVLHESGSQLNDTVYDHLHYMVNVTRGLPDHWDIMNELVHGQWFEEHVHDPDYSQKLFKEVHSLDPAPLLMLNDYSVVARPEIADAYLQQAQRFLANGVPLQGLGIQGHFHSNEPDPQLMMLYLDHVAKAGLPLWVTELDVWQTDPEVRADHYERALRMFFSHPAVEGVVFWGFWDQHVVNKTSSLVDGNELKINAAGQRYINLTKQEWSTHVNRSLSSGANFDLRGFKGHYEMTVRRNGVKVKSLPFTLSGNETTVHVDIDDQIDIPPPGLRAGSQLDDLGSYVVGAGSSSSGASLTCHNHYSGQSAAQDGAIATGFCRSDHEVLAGCSSILKNHDWHRQGDQMTDSGGQMQCSAVDGTGATAGVQAIYQCCQLAGLKCTYRASGSSAPGKGTMAEARCLQHEVPIGCSAWGPHDNGAGLIATNTSCYARNNDPNTGVYAYAACCHAPSLVCVTVTSSPRAQCPSGYVMTSCSFWSEGGARAAGVTVSAQGTCQAVPSGTLSPGQEIKSVAICCKA